MTKIITVRVTDTDHRNLKIEAAKACTSIQGLVSELLAEYLDETTVPVTERISEMVNDNL